MAYLEYNLEKNLVQSIRVGTFRAFIPDVFYTIRTFSFNSRSELRQHSTNRSSETTKLMVFISKKYKYFSQFKPFPYIFKTSDSDGDLVDGEATDLQQARFKFFFFSFKKI